MAQFDLYANPSRETSGAVPYLLDLQSDLLDPLATRVVAPLFWQESAGPPAETLMPRFEIDGRTVVMSTPELAGVSRSQLGSRIGSLADRRDDIIAALDMLFTGI